MNKIITIAILCSLLSCTPFQRMLISPANLNSFLEDSCDLQIVTGLKQSLDTAEHNIDLNQSLLLKELIEDSDCEYYGYRLDPFHEDSGVWFMTIRPAKVGKTEFIVGSLYTFDPHQDTDFTFQRRIKAYSQKERFETGQYVVFSYRIENDTTIITRAGISK